MAVALRAHETAVGHDEQVLVAAVRRGDDRAFAQLYSRYRPRIRAFVQGMVADHGRAEDIAQEVFISALRRLRATEQPVHFKPWLYEIAKNACIDEFRRARRAREVPLEDDEGGEGASHLHSLSPTPDLAIESKQQLDHLRGAFRGLSESHHRILVLRELEGLSYNQIGDRLGISKPVVESTLFRARRKLGEEYAEIESGRRCARVQGLIAAADVRPVRSLGLRERRLLTRHLADCAACRRQAWAGGIDCGETPPASRARRLAATALAPAPFLRLRASQSSGEVTASATHVAGAARALGPLAPLLGAGGSLPGLGRAATAAALAIAGAGGGIVAEHYGSSPSAAPTITHVSAATPAFARVRATSGSVFVASPFRTGAALPLVIAAPGTPGAGGASAALPAIPAGDGSPSAVTAGIGVADVAFEGYQPGLAAGSGTLGQLGPASGPPSGPAPATEQSSPGGTGTTQPAGGAGTTQPIVGTGTIQPAGGAGTTQPIVGTGTTQPVVGAGTTQPVAGAGTTQPVAGGGTSQPVAGPGVGQTSDPAGSPPIAAAQDGATPPGSGDPKSSAPGADAPGHGAGPPGAEAAGQSGSAGGGAADGHGSAKVPSDPPGASVSAAVSGHRDGASAAA